MATGTWFNDITETDIEHIVARSEAHDSGLCAANPRSHGHRDPNAYADSNADANGDAATHAEAKANLHSEADAHSHADADSHAAPHPSAV